MMYHHLYMEGVHQGNTRCIIIYIWKVFIKVTHDVYTEGVHQGNTQCTIIYEQSELHTNLKHPGKKKGAPLAQSYNRVERKQHECTKIIVAFY